MSNEKTATTPANDTRKPEWPHKSEVSMTAHPNGTWVKKCRGKQWAFGVWRDPDTALARWRREWPSIVQHGCRPAEVTTYDPATLTVKDAMEEYLLSKRSARERGELADPTLRKYRIICQIVSDTFGKSTPLNRIGQKDFRRLLDAISGQSPTRRADTVVQVRSIFKWIDEELDYRVKTGREFKGPPARVLRRHRHERRARVFSRHDIHKLLHRGTERDRAIIMLAVNCGLAQSDLTHIKAHHVDLKRGWINTIREKNAADIIAPLWPETVRRLRPVARKTGLLIATRDGAPLVHGKTDQCKAMMDRLRKKTGVTGTFQWFRTGFATIAAQKRDKHARQLIMGHTIPGVHEGYIENFPRERLLRVSNHVRDWLLSREQCQMEPADDGDEYEA